MTHAIQDDVAADALAEERALVAKLLPLWEARQAKNEASKDEERLSGPVKQFLELNPDVTSLDDLEHDVHASLQRRGSTEWDLRPLADDDVLALKAAGLLTIRTRAFDELRKAAQSTTWDRVNHTRGVRLEGESFSLIVKRD